ncbi:MAG: PIN domain-containing protein [Desulfococcaceae bacterium]|nr:PIN domain-containing protein [Desulfococcaceae bacterium]
MNLLKSWPVHGRIFLHLRKEARQSARIRSDLEKEGTPIGPFDTLIAGTALAHSAVLVTHNTKEFKRIRGLQIEYRF